MTIFTALHVTILLNVIMSSFSSLTLTPLPPKDYGPLTQPLLQAMPGPTVPTTPLSAPSMSPSTMTQLPIIFFSITRASSHLCSPHGVPPSMPATSSHDRASPLPLSASTQHFMPSCTEAIWTSSVPISFPLSLATFHQKTPRNNKSAMQHLIPSTSMMRAPRSPLSYGHDTCTPIVSWQWAFFSLTPPAVSSRRVSLTSKTSSSYTNMMATTFMLNQ
jgi:hypothetical protein